MMLLGVIDANDMIIEAQLDSKIYNVGLSWNEEGQFWTISIRDLNMSILASGIAVVHNWPLLNRVRRPEFPTGDLGVYLSDGKNLDRRAFADGFALLFYFTAEEMLYGEV